MVLKYQLVKKALIINLLISDLVWIFNHQISFCLFFYLEQKPLYTQSTQKRHYEKS